MAIFKRTLLILILLPSQIAWAQSPHDYFDWLSQQSESIVSNAYRTQAEIDRDSAPKFRPNDKIVYDPAHDAARVRHLANNSGVLSTNQVRPSLDNTGFAKSPNLLISTGTLLFTWDAKWGSGFLNVKNQGLEVHKEFQIGSQEIGHEDRWLEIRSRYSLSDSTYISKIDLRSYIHSHAGDRLPMGRDGCPANPGNDCQINSFEVQVDTWTRYWVFIDFGANTLTFWMADEKNTPIKQFDAFPVIWSQGVNGFWFEYNSSQDRTGPEISAWFRNFAVLRNVSNVNAIVAQGANVGAGPSDPSPPDTTPPSAPTNLDAQ